MSYQDILTRIADGKLIILDGGVGSELQKKGVIMDPHTWAGPASLENPSVLEEIHLDCIHAGADITTANIFASSPIML